MKYRPFIADVHITSRCNLNCNECHIRGWYKTKKDLSLKVFRIRMQKLASVGIKEVLFGGGEPSLHPKLEELIKIASQYGLKVGIVTNGIGYPNLNSAMVTVNRWKNLGLSKMRVSIDVIHNTNKYGNKKPAPLLSAIFLLIASLKYLSDVGVHYIITKSTREKTNKLINRVINCVYQKIGKSARKIRKIPLYMVPEGKSFNYDINDLPQESEYESCMHHEKLKDGSKLKPRMTLKMDGSVYSCPFMSIKLGNMDKKLLKEILKRNNKLIDIYEKFGLKKVKSILLEKGIIKDGLLESVPCRMCHNLSTSKKRLNIIYGELKKV